MNHTHTFSPRTIVLVGMLSALVFALSSVEILIPLSFGDGTRIHFGNIMCLLSGVLFGPMVGGLASGFGSMIYDLTHPLYITEFWITFLTKFAMGALAGLLAQKTFAKLHSVPRVLLAGLGGQLGYLVLYLAKTAIQQHFVNGLPWQGVGVVLVGKLAVSGFNGLMAVVCCTLLAPPLAAALHKSGLFKNRPRHAG